jgi:hypothetical protein
MKNKLKVKLKPKKPSKMSCASIPQDKSSVKSAKKKVMNDNMNSKVKRIMRVNMEKNDISDSHAPFVSRFLRSLLKEQDEAAAPAATAPAAPAGDVAGSNQKAPADFSPEGDKQAFDQSMQPGTDPKEFDTQGVNPQVTSDTINSIKEWSSKLDEFASFLNDPSTESLHKILADGDRAGSLLRGVTRKASDSITRIAGEVEKLKEILNTYIITAPKKLRDTEQQVSGWTQY